MIQGLPLPQPCASANTDEALLAQCLLTSCCVAQFLTGHEPVPVHGPGVWDTFSKGATQP